MTEAKKTPSPKTVLKEPPGHMQKSEDRIYQAMMRGGGEPFGKPFELSLSTLTQKIVSYFKQKGFFHFETLDKQPPPHLRNKFTKYGASNFIGDYPETSLKKEQKGKRS